MMDRIWDELRDLRRRQDSDFETMMVGFVTVRKAMEDLQASFEAYRRGSGQVLDKLQAAVVITQHENQMRFERIEQRLDDLEGKPPAA